MVRQVLILTKKLGGLRHGETDEVVLALATGATSLVEHLQGLECCSRSHASRVGLLGLATSAVKLLVLSHGIILVEVLLLGFVSREHAQSAAEQAGIARRSSVLGCGAGSRRVIIRAAGNVAV